MSPIARVGERLRTCTVRCAQCWPTEIRWVLWFSRILLRFGILVGMAWAIGFLVQLATATFVSSSPQGRWLADMGWWTAIDDLASWGFVPAVPLVPAVLAYVVLDTCRPTQKLAGAVYWLLAGLVCIWWLADVLLPGKHRADPAVGTALALTSLAIAIAARKILPNRQAGVTPKAVPGA